MFGKFPQNNHEKALITYLLSMIQDIVNACYWPGPCCSTNVVVPDTMCDTAFQIDHGFPNAAAGGCSLPSGPYEYPQADIEMDSLMHTLQENPNFYDSATFLPPSLPMTTLQGGGYDDNYGVNEQPRMFTTEYAYNQKYPPTTQTPVGSPDPGPQGQVPAQFEEFSLATQLPRLNDYNGAYIVPDTTPAIVDSTKFQSFEPYSAQYFFTTPPDTPPNMYPPLQQLPAQPTTCVRQPASSDSDPTPTIRKLLQQKKKRIACALLVTPGPRRCGAETTWEKLSAREWVDTYHRYQRGYTRSTRAFRRVRTLRL
ncbi:unnamed protein product [Haemonchus placei]|uniref:Uncharacterized protein n=1 Tax=Haemonchus placei TaxID=6290 RepID=A0A0N4WG39_HAEPC|nr:unnamed protein product [Haemonchus placei]